MKRFNTTGLMISGQHYMVRIDRQETRDLTRSDLVIDYHGHQYVVELKIWHGNSYNERGEQQLKDYLDYFRVQEGYLVSFCFNKNKQPGIRDVAVGDRTICEAIV